MTILSLPIESLFFIGALLCVVALVREELSTQSTIIEKIQRLKPATYGGQATVGSLSGSQSRAALGAMGQSQQLSQREKAAMQQQSYAMNAYAAQGMQCPHCGQNRQGAMGGGLFGLGLL
jgi:hypothetical protein